MGKLFGSTLERVDNAAIVIRYSTVRVISVMEVSLFFFLSLSLFLWVYYMLAFRKDTTTYIRVLRDSLTLSIIKLFFFPFFP